MNTQLPKVLHEVCGRPMLEYVLDACRAAGVTKMILVVGHGKEHIIGRYQDDGDVVFVEQTEQKGTGHAVMMCREELEKTDGQVLILCGDAPMIRTETLRTLIKKHESEKCAVTLATTVLDNPFGYGRIVRDEYGNIQGIVEEKDCTDQQRRLTEVNPAYYCFNSNVLLETLAEIRPNNVKNEYYLTDAIHISISKGYKVVAVTAVAPEDSMGINNRQQLSEANSIMQERIQGVLMDEGVTIVDPPNTWIDVRARIGQDTIIEPFTYIHGDVTIGSHCRIGPFAYLRGQVDVADHVELGVFTEVRDSRLDSGVRARHHSFISEAVLGRDVNVGAGSILISPEAIAEQARIRPGSVMMPDEKR
jgi:bifunctional UDP-N-acetylglucosamine pyrophosphorylase/glucosamine-1-phosphate N-acetyltransferase